MFCSSVSGFQLPVGAIEESNSESRKVSLKSYLPLPSEAYWPPPRLAIGPKESTVLCQFSLLRYGPTFVAICANVESIWHASLMALYKSSRLPSISGSAVVDFGASRPVFAFQMSAQYFQFSLLSYSDSVGPVAARMPSYGLGFLPAFVSSLA